MGAGAGLHGDDAAGWQLGTPRDEFVAVQGAAGKHASGAVNGVNLDDAFGQIDADANGLAACRRGGGDGGGDGCARRGTSCNLFHETSPFSGL